MENRHASRIKVIRKFRFQRIDEIKAGDTPFPLVDGAKILLHIVPSNAFDPSVRYDIDSLNIDWESFPPLHLEQPEFGARVHSFPAPERVLDGIIVCSQLSHSSVKIRYDGVIEADDAYFLNARKNEKILLKPIEEELLQPLQKYLQLQKQLNIELPLFIMLSYLGVRGYFVHGCRSQIDKDDIVIPEIEINSFERKLDEIMKKISNRFLSECGIHKR